MGDSIVSTGKLFQLFIVVGICMNWFLMKWMLVKCRMLFDQSMVPYLVIMVPYLVIMVPYLVIMVPYLVIMVPYLVINELY